MATSTNYGWSEPDNTSLVKDGAQAMRTLGNAIDTSLWNSGYGQAGKNKIINGDFGIWQRGTTLTGTGVYFYTADRWETYAWGTNTVTRQAFTAGAAPAAPYESPYFLRISSTSTNTFLSQKIEDVRSFAGQQVTFSFWAKTAATNAVTEVNAVQLFGTGGSTQVVTSIIPSGSITITTSWQRFTKTFTVPSVSGKTIGANSSLSLEFRTNAINQNFDVWGVQAEYGSTGTPFQTASGGSAQGELAMCQRYYVRITDQTTADVLMNSGSAISTTQTLSQISLAVPMRVAPTVLEAVNVRLYDGVSAFAITAAALTNTGNQIVQVIYTVASGLTQYRPYRIIGNAGATYLGFSAEL